VLARPRWWIGQVLIPEHFLGLEDALSADAALHASLSGWPSHGVARLDWNGHDPRGGELTVFELCAVLPTGIVIDASLDAQSGNARFVGPLDLKAPGRRQVEAYAHLLASDERADGEGALEPPSPREIPRRIHRVLLSVEPSVEGSLGRVELGHFEADAKGAFRLSERFVPPLRALGATPYFATQLSQLTAQLAELEASLDHAASAAAARGESTGSLFHLRVEARKMEALLSDIRRGVHLHPYPLFIALRAFALELGLLDEHAAPFTPPAYAHDELAHCFGVVFEEIASRIRVPLPESAAVPFVADNGRLVAAELPSAALEAKELYVVVLKASEADRLSLDGTLLASPGRLRLVREHALRSMRLSSAPNASLRHRFGGPVEIYRIVGAGASAGDEREWSSVQRERAIAFHMPKALEGQTVLLCWR